MDITTAILIFTPILLPLAKKNAGIDLVYFGLSKKAYSIFSGGNNSVIIVNSIPTISFNTT